VSGDVVGGLRIGMYALHTRISRTRTMKPMMPPPVPYCVALELRVVNSSAAIGAAEHRAARQSWRMRENMVCLCFLCDVELEGVGWVLEVSQ
jgi:hypothetical protein